MIRNGFDAEAVPAQNQTRRILAYCSPKMVLTMGSTIFLYYHRTVFGMKALLYRLRAQVDVKAVMNAERR
jgi:hypothetical protein